MFKGFWVVSALAVALGAPTAASATAERGPAAGLPDFPADAEPGACYARLRDDGRAGDAGSEGKWTLKRGHGPEAVWRYSEDGAPAAAHAGAYRWVRVACEPGQIPFGGDTYAHAGPATGTTGAGLTPPLPMLAPPPPPPVMEPPPHALPHHPAPPPHAAPHHVPPPPHEPFVHGPPLPEMGPPTHPAPHHAGPPAHGAFMFGPPPHHPAPFAGPHVPGPHFAGPPMPPPQPVSPPRWFGDRFLNWAGKPPPAW